MDAIGVPWSLLGQGGAAFILAGVVWAIITGRLVPRKTLEDLVSERDKRIAAEAARADEWHKAAEAQDARNDILSRQVDQLLDAARTTNGLVDGLKRAIQERRR